MSLNFHSGLHAIPPWKGNCRHNPARYLMSRSKPLREPIDYSHEQMGSDNRRKCNKGMWVPSKCVRGREEGELVREEGDDLPKS